jgi:LemA protein
MLIFLGIIGFFVLIALFVFGSFKSAQNQMVQKDEQTKKNWAQIDVQLERRANLIPNLVETVKGFTKEESTVFGDIANARAGVLNASDPKSKIAANGQLDVAVSRLMGYVENYPQLKSSDQFMRLQDELSGTENRIGVARQRYNNSIEDYNAFIRQFPQSIWAGILGFHTNDAYFTASPASRNVPTVKF